MDAQLQDTILARDASGETMSTSPDHRYRFPAMGYRLHTECSSVNTKMIYVARRRVSSTRGMCSVRRGM
jgi:hypothetical protein